MTLAGIGVDKTAPLISASRDKAANAAGWNNSDVTVSFICGDGPTRRCLASCGRPRRSWVGAAGRSATGTATDLAGNTASVTLAGINVDKTAPTIVTQRSVAANAAGWNNSDVTVSFICGRRPGKGGVLRAGAGVR